MNTKACTIFKYKMTGIINYWIYHQDYLLIPYYKSNRWIEHYKLYIRNGKMEINLNIF